MNANNGAAHHNGDATAFSNLAAGKFDPLGALQAWQRGAARFRRANEQLLEGLTAAAQMQVALGQELMERQVSAVKKFNIGFTQATRTLFEQVETEAKESVAEAVRKSDFAAARKTAQTAEARG